MNLGGNQSIKVYQTKTAKLAGTNFHEVRKKADSVYQAIIRGSKRRPYVRSAYFNKDKVFLALFWQHLWDQQNWQVRMRRLKFFDAGIALLKNSRLEPISKENPNRKNEILHRFAGVTKCNELFFLQVKEDKKSGQKYLISIFPVG